MIYCVVLFLAAVVIFFVAGLIWISFDTTYFDEDGFHPGFSGDKDNQD